jgi:hypothetical protein
MPAKKKTTAKKSSSSPRARAKVGKVMGEFKRGQLKSGGRRKVKNPKQAIAIGLNEARRAGAKVPAKGAAAKKKGAAKKSATRKTAAGKTTAKKSAPRRKRA